MARRFDLTGAKDKIQRRNAQRDTYGNQTPLSSTAVERGETHWMDGSYVRIDGLLDVNGTATVGGTLSVTGTLNASGDINLSGTTDVTGPLTIQGVTTISGQLNVTGPTSLDGILTINGDTTITGQLDIDGPATISGTLDIEGITTLNNDLNVLGNGKIKVGSDLTISPASSGGGELNFNNGTRIIGGNGSVQIDGGTSQYLFGTTGFTADTGGGAIFELMADNTWALAGGGGSIMANGAGILSMGYTRANLSGTLEVGNNLVVNGDVVRMPNLVTVTAAPNVYITSNGTLRKTTWTP